MVSAITILLKGNKSSENMAIQAKSVMSQLKKRLY
jgi:hypothetical protein